MNWFKLLKAKESMAFGTEEGIQFGMEDLRYFEECCEEARTLFLRLVNSSVILTMPEKLMYEHQTAELNCEDFRAYLEEEYRYARDGKKAIVIEVLEAWDECEETRHKHRSDNV